MSKITEVYMDINGRRVCLSMEQFCKMREKQPELKKLKFIPVDNRMYQATAKQYLEWRKEQNHRDYLAKFHVENVSLEQFRDDGNENAMDELLHDTSVDVEETAVMECLFEAVRKAFARLTEDEKRLITALIIQGMTEREYARITGIPQKTINDRKTRILSKLKKFMNFQK